MKNEPILFVSGGGRSFQRNQESDLVTALEQQDAATLLMPVSQVTDLVLDTRGRLPDGYRFTAAAFRQVCGLLAPGLFRAVADLAGEYQAATSVREDYSVAEASHIYNSVLKRRFTARLEGARLVRHVDEKRIDGVIGSRYRWLDNRSFLAAIQDALGCGPLSIRFVEATLSGRRLSVRFAARVSIAELPDGGSVYPGYFFVNSESGGESPVQGSSLLVMPRLKGYALGPLVTGGRLVHVGKDFGKKLELLCAEVAQTVPDSEWVKLALRHTSQRNLRIPNDREERRTRVRKLVRWLQRREVPSRLSRRCVDSALGLGAHDDSPFFIPSRNFDSIVVYDLYKSLVDCAKSLYPLARERLERAAYDVLKNPSL